MEFEEKKYGRFYEQLTGRIRRSGAACFALRAAGAAATILMYLAYPLLLAILFYSSKSAPDSPLNSVLGPGAPLDSVLGPGSPLDSVLGSDSPLDSVLGPGSPLNSVLRPGLSLLRAVLVPGAAFLVLSAVRKRIDRPRPYEAWGIVPLIPREKKGESMPSRHVFSSAVIAMAWLRACPPAGAVLLLAAVFEAFVRVVGGVHYPSDVAAGYIAGVLAGLLLFL